jgi:alcohol dehydrogenase class IV
MSAFTWRDGPRTVHYGEGVSEHAAELLGEHGWEGFQVLTTERADPGIGPAVYVPEGQIPDIAERLLGEVTADRLVAWGGGRVIDVAKAIASATGAQVAAVPTTLSGAEMTGSHRRIAGREGNPPVRPVLVIADPRLMCSLDEPALRASAMNALAHGAEALYGPMANPVSSLAAQRGVELIAFGDRALGALLCSYAMDSAGYALHHVLCQTVVRIAGTRHAETNAAMLPRTMSFVAGRAPEALTGLAEALGCPLGDIGRRLDALGGRARIDVPPELVDAVVRAALGRPELAATPGGGVTADDIRSLLAPDG